MGNCPIIVTHYIQNEHKAIEWLLSVFHDFYLISFHKVQLQTVVMVRLRLLDNRTSHLLVIAVVLCQTFHGRFVRGLRKM